MSELTTITPNDLLAKAVDSGLGMEQLEKLMDLQERWEKNQARKSFFAAMNSFQAVKPEIKRTDAVSHDKGVTIKYKFAPLSKIQKEIDPVLSSFGLSYSFKQEHNGDKIKITCVVAHVDGHKEETWIEGGSDMSVGKNAIQAIGSTVSYFQRYTVKNAFGLSEGDDDAQSVLSPDEINEMMLEKLIELRASKGGELEEQRLNRLDEIIANEETNSYKKSIKILEEL